MTPLTPLSKLPRAAAPSSSASLGPVERRAAELLARAAEVAPPPLSPSAMARIEGQVLGARSGRPSWSWLGVGVGACLGVAATLALLPQAPDARRGASSALTIRNVRVPAGGAAQLSATGGAQLWLLGSGALSLDPERAQASLDDGRLVLRTGATAVTVQSGAGRVVVAPGRLVEVTMQLGQLVRVAAYVGAVEAYTSDAASVGQPVAAGTAWTRQGSQPLAAECVRVAQASEPSAWPAGCVGEAGSAPVGLIDATPRGETTDEAEPPSPPVEPQKPVAPSRSHERPRMGPRTESAAMTQLTHAPEASAIEPQGAEPAPAESALAAESRLLGVALHALRQERDAAAALRTLEQYQDRFPRGLLAEEAQAARVDALLALDRRHDALALLDRAEFRRLGRGGELRLLRGELRAGAERCADAIADFSAVLDESASGGTAVGERALAGRARCFTQLGDTRRARADWQALLARAPHGAAAEAAQRALRTLPVD